VAIATAAKAKLLLRELKTIKADLAFAKERSKQLEEENKMLRDALEKGDHPADDDMARIHFLHIFQNNLTYIIYTHYHINLCAIYMIL